MTVDSRQTSGPGGVHATLKDWLVLVEDTVGMTHVALVRASSGRNAMKIWEINHPNVRNLMARAAAVKPEQVFGLGEDAGGDDNG